MVKTVHQLVQVKLFDCDAKINLNDISRSYFTKMAKVCMYPKKTLWGYMKKEDIVDNIVAGNLLLFSSSTGKIDLIYYLYVIIPCNRNRKKILNLPVSLDWQLLFGVLH